MAELHDEALSTATPSKSPRSRNSDLVTFVGKSQHVIHVDHGLPQQFQVMRFAGGTLKVRSSREPASPKCGNVELTVAFPPVASILECPHNGRGLREGPLILLT